MNAKITHSVDQAAKEALTDMPPRAENELDPVTLHNQALMTMEDNPMVGFDKLHFLLTLPNGPPETLSNLFLLFIKYENYDLAADLLAEFQSQAKMTVPAVSIE